MHRTRQWSQDDIPVFTESVLVRKFEQSCKDHEKHMINSEPPSKAFIL
jgi:hypothetical protein